MEIKNGDRRPVGSPTKYKMKWLLIIYIFSNGEWKQGDPEQGWGAMPVDSKEICLQKKANGERVSDPAVYKFKCKIKTN